MQKKIIFTLIIFLSFFFPIYLSGQTSIYNKYPIAGHEWFTRNTPDSVRLYIFEFGEGKDTIVVLHGGFGAEHSYLLDAFEGLYDKYHFVFYDQRGSLRSPCPDSLINMDKMIEDLEGIRKELRIKKLNLFGHSNGTTLASLYLKKYPHHVMGFIMCAFLKPQYPVPVENGLRAIETSEDRGFQEFVNREAVKREISKINVSEIPGKAVTYKQRIAVASYSCFDIINWKKQRTGFWSFYNIKAGNAVVNSIPKGGYNLIPVFTQHPYPITVIMGDHDMIDFGGELYGRWFKEFPNMERILIKNAGHDTWLDQPEQFKRAFIKAMNKYNNK